MIEIIRRTATGAVAFEVINPPQKKTENADELREARLRRRAAFETRWRPYRRFSHRNCGRKPLKRFTRVSIRTAA